MECAKILVLAPVRVHAVVQANRADWQRIPKAKANRIAHVFHSDIGVALHVSRVDKNGALQSADDRKRKFSVEHREELAAKRMTVIILWPKIALGKTSHGRGATIEETNINRDALIN